MNSKENNNPNEEVFIQEMENLKKQVEMELIGLEKRMRVEKQSIMEKPLIKMDKRMDVLT